MRLHRSWWRSEVLRVPYGVGPSATSKRSLGNYLQPDAAEAGMNFLTPQIFETVQRRIAAGSGVERYRCLYNLLSSQPMCFNLVAPLIAGAPAYELATRLFATMVPGLERVTDVRIEYAPKPKAEYLGDATSFDAFVEYLDHDGQRAFVGIETKLTEPFSKKSYLMADSPRYTAVTTAADATWLPNHDLAVEDVRWNQLWRNQMLVEAVRTHPSGVHGIVGSLAVVRHPLDQVCAQAIAGYRPLLRDPDGVLDWTLDALVGAWETVAKDEEQTWLANFRRRYVDLDSSEGLGPGRV